MDGEVAVLCADRCHASLAEVGEGNWASFSERDGCCGWPGAGGKEAAIMSYAEGVRSTSEASSCKFMRCRNYSEYLYNSPEEAVCIADIQSS